MTILNVWLSDTRALVAVDTLGSKPRTLEPWEISKMLPMAHANCVLAGAGNMGVLHRLHWQLLQHQGDFDFMSAAIPQIIDPSFREFAAEAAGFGLGEDDLTPHQTIVLVGWSKAAGGMRGLYVDKSRSEEVFNQPTVIDPYLLHPDISEASLPQAPDTASKMEAHASKQVAWGRQNFPQWAIGGRLLVAYLDRDSMTITSRPLNAA